MTGRAVLFHRPDYIPGTVMNFHSAEKGTFHKIGTINGNSCAIVEDSGGTFVPTILEYVRFCTPFEPKK